MAANATVVVNALGDAVPLKSSPVAVSTVTLRLVAALALLLLLLLLLLWSLASIFSGCCLCGADAPPLVVLGVALGFGAWAY